MKPLTAYEVAEELGRSKDWLYANWRKLSDKDGMPRPIRGGGKGVELAWSAVQFYAWLDKDLPKPLRDHVAAIRAATDAIKASPAITSEARIVDQWKENLNKRFGT